ncbi:MAG: hypothetical protein F6J92_25560 [Symploca sp. SIO1A3]|nr:hypothetical protein [Symploca sp. SIO1A3]
MSRTFLSQQEIEAASAQYGTPLYLYSLNKIDRQYAQLKEHLPQNFRIHYALKANSNLTICHRLAQLGAAADVSSLGELSAALKTGFSPELILFTGPGKTNPELAAALEAGISTIVLESVNEAHRLNNLARQNGKKQKVLLRINPLYRTSESCEISQKSNVGAKHLGDNSSVKPKLYNPNALPSDSLKTDPSRKSNNQNGSASRVTIQTIATTASKFGVDEAQAEEAIATISSLSHLNLQGIHIFTESNVLDYQQLLAAWQNTIAIANRLNEQGYPLSQIDFGGSIGIPYNAVDDEFAMESFGWELQQVFQNNPYPYNCMVEIGRYLVGEAGCYVTEIVDIKESQGKRFIILDGGVHQLFRLSMKKASKYMEVLGKNGSRTQQATLTGKLPTPLDIMVEDVEIPEDIAIGDRLVIYNCGAYGFNHSLTNFNLHQYPAEIAYSNGEKRLIREPGNIEDFFLNQTLPFVENSKELAIFCR